MPSIFIDNEVVTKKAHYGHVLATKTANGQARNIDIPILVHYELDEPLSGANLFKKG